MSALKLTFPSNLPKNEKDLICMLLAGRLKDLLNGRLVCAQLAIDDLIKDATGISALGTLRDSLVNMKSAINGLKAATGYDKILQGVNQALGQVNNVFSLGGLCPSPVRAPQIPDLLAQLNSNMFGQASNILNALGKVSNPSMCLGGGPGGFGINWNSMPGDLKNLKAAIAQAGNTPAATINAFNQNLKAQTSRLKSEIKRLEQNLADPLGLNNKLNTARNIQRVKSISDGYPVKDSRGITHANVLKTMISADIESVIDSGDRTPVKYITKPVLDYCGDIVGYEKVAVSGDPAYIGWDPNGDPALNTDNPTVNPVAGFASYTYTFKQTGTEVQVYDTAGTVVTALNLSRGTAYRLSFELTDKQIQFYSDAARTVPWTEGLIYSRSPAYGKDMEIITPDDTTTFVRGELDWAVLIETPELKPTFNSTPNDIYWRTIDNAYSGKFAITGPTEIPVADRTYDVSMAVKKACLHLVNVPATTELPVNREQFDGVNESTNRTYKTTTSMYNTDGGPVGTIEQDPARLQVKVDIETSDELGNTDTNNKIIKSIVKITASTWLITKRYVSIENGLEFNQIYFYISNTENENDSTNCLLLKFNNPITILNSTKLPYTDFYSYKLTQLVKSGDNFVPSSTPISNSDETKFELIQRDGKEFIRWNLTSYTEAQRAQVPRNEFIFQTDIEIDPADISRIFINSDPIEYRTYFYFKLADGTAIESTIAFADRIPLPPDTGGTGGGGTGGGGTGGGGTGGGGTGGGGTGGGDTGGGGTGGGGTGGGGTGGGSTDVWYFNGTACILAQGGFVPGPVTTFSTLQACQAANNGDGTFGPAPGMLYGRDYYTYNSSEPNVPPEYIDLRNKTPIKVTYEPLEIGKGVGYEWLVDGKSFNTGIFYTEELTNPRHWAFGKLSNAEALLIRTEYINSFNPPLDFIYSPGEFNSPNSIPSSFWNNFLVSKGIRPATGSTFTSTHGDVYTWNGSSWNLTTRWTRP